MVRLVLALAAFVTTACTMTACTGTTKTPDSPEAGDSNPDTDTGPIPDTDSDTDTGPDIEAEPGFVVVRASTFAMGCTDGQSDCDADETEHSVTLTHDYVVSETEVTQAQFEAILGYNPSIFIDCGADCPVENVSWHMSAAYANAMSDAAGLSPCYACVGTGSDVQCESSEAVYACDGYRLLTEAEWEGAARCGTDLLYAGSDNINEVGWVGGNSGDLTHAVAGLAPNACGIYDMSGNVWEWTQDWYAAYEAGSATDPTGPASGTGRSVRGGGWDGGAPRARVSGRTEFYPDGANYYFGFRLGRTIP
jgi:formylglycine-generating enzyme required for sulfatase activity